MIIPRAFNSSPVPTEAHVALVLVGFICLVLFQGYALWKGQPFSPEAFGQAMGILLTGGGAAALGQGYLTRARSSSLAGLAQAVPTAKPDNPDA